MAKQLSLKQYSFQRRVHTSINCLLDPLGQDSVAIGVDSIAVASPASAALPVLWFVVPTNQRWSAQTLARRNFSTLTAPWQGACQWPTVAQ